MTVVAPRRREATIPTVTQVSLREGSLGDYFSRLPIVSPEPDYLHYLLLQKNLVDEPVQDVDTPGASAGEISEQLFEGWWRLVGVLPQDFQKGFSFGFQTCGGQLPTGQTYEIAYAMSGDGQFV
jgi:hypothetical protein